MQVLIGILEHWIQTAGGWGVFGASVAEEVFSLIPSSAVQIAAGVFIMSGLPFSAASFGKLIIEIAIPAALGVAVGSLIYVWLARKFGILIIEKYGKWVGVSMDHVRSLEKKMQGTVWDDVIFIGLRAFPAIPAIALAVYAGIIEMPWKKYFVLTFLGVMIRATGLAIIGWLFRNQFERWSHDFGWVITLVSVLVIVILGIMLWKWYRSLTKENSSN